MASEYKLRLQCSMYNVQRRWRLCSVGVRARPAILGQGRPNAVVKIRGDSTAFHSPGHLLSPLLAQHCPLFPRSIVSHLLHPLFTTLPSSDPVMVKETYVQSSLTMDHLLAH